MLSCENDVVFNPQRSPYMTIYKDVKLSDLQANGELGEARVPTLLGESFFLLKFISFFSM